MGVRVGLGEDPDDNRDFGATCLVLGVGVDVDLDLVLVLVRGLDAALVLPSYAVRGMAQ